MRTNQVTNPEVQSTVHIGAHKKHDPFHKQGSYAETDSVGVGGVSWRAGHSMLLLRNRPDKTAVFSDDEHHSLRIPHSTNHSSAQLTHLTSKLSLITQNANLHINTTR